MSRILKSSQRMHASGCTPNGIRRFFSKLEVVGKGRAELSYEYSELDPVVDTPTHKDLYRENTACNDRNIGSDSTSVLPREIREICGPQLDRFGLMNEDTAMDAVVVTTLDDIPFCCHEDLITMPRDKLIGVASSLNAKLPSAMAIDIDSTLPTSFIRSSIELVVGLRLDVPQAPRTLRLLTDAEVDALGLLEQWSMMNRTPPTSPLAQRSQSYGNLTSLVSPIRLAKLEEEEESDIEEADRYSKRRRISKEAIEGASNPDISTELQQTPTPLPHIQRVRSHNVTSGIFPSPPRVHHPKSQKLEKTTAIDITFMHNKRSPSHNQRKPKPTRTCNTSTVDAIPQSIDAPRRSKRLRPVRLDSVPTASSRLKERQVSVWSKRNSSVGRAEVVRQVTSEMR